MNRGRLIILAAASGTGKTSLSRALIERLRQRGIGAAFSVSYTTRAPRVGEVDGRDYQFISPETFAQMVEQGDFLEHATVFGRSYGTSRAATERELVAGRYVFLDIDWQGAQQIRAQMPHDTVSIFLLPPSLAELERRLRSRGQDSEDSIAQRMQAAAAEIAHAGEFQHQLVNDDFEQTLAALERLVAPL